VGDAAAFIDPVFSSGVQLALAGAFQAAAAIDAALARRRFSRAAFAGYERWLRRTERTYRDFVRAFYRPETVELLLHPTDKLKLRQAVTSLLSGHGADAFAVSWRVRLFSVFARLNRDFELTARRLSDPGTKNSSRAIDRRRCAGTFVGGLKPCQCGRRRRYLSRNGWISCPSIDMETGMDLGLKGKRAVITGGSKGIGRAIADAFAAEGAGVSICARNADEVATVVAALKARGVKAYGRALDVADGLALADWISASAGELGGIDALVCNVSALAVGDSAETWEKSFRVDMMHTVNAVAAAVPFLEKSNCGSIVLISSVSGFEVDFAAGSYGAFKAALIHYAKGLSRQLVGKGIRVNCVSPGNTYFDGGIWQTIEKNVPDLFSSTLKVNPTGKFGTPAEVASGVVFLASPVASRISGTNLVIDGALTVAV
jgi:3-oxoacyl-[acyl-carrier protein] reductase